MFKIEANFEDLRIRAYSSDGKTFSCQFEDTHTGDISDTIQLSALQLSYVLQFNLDSDGEPEGFEQMYESLEPIFKDWSNHLRPIP